MPSPIQTLFLPTPNVLYVDEDYTVNPPAYDTVDTLMRSLQNHGPLLAIGIMGPNAHSEDPYILKDRTCDTEVYGWKAGTFNELAPRIPTILLGVRQSDSSATVYFTLAEDMTGNDESFIRGYWPLETDTKVYALSYANFRDRSLHKLYAKCPNVELLYSLQLDVILNHREVMESCKRLGQRIFDHYKNQAGGDSEAGKYSLGRIHHAANLFAKECSDPQSYIERAWEGVGDEHWQWQQHSI